MWFLENKFVKARIRSIWIRKCSVVDFIDRSNVFGMHKREISLSAEDLVVTIK